MSVLMAPMPGIVSTYDGAGSISGTITDASGSPARRRIVLLARRTVVAVRRVDSADDGTYSLPGLTTAVEFVRLVQDDEAGDLQNDLVDRVFAG